MLFGWWVRIDDIKIIYNDWPYGIDKSIVHLCVWTKFPLDVDENDPNGDLTPEMRAKIDKYVDKTFGSRVPAENVSISSFDSSLLSSTTNKTLYLFLVFGSVQLSLSFDIRTF